MNNTFYVIPKDSDLTHYGVLGMKWGVRRYQNDDGTLTTAGQRRYQSKETSNARRMRTLRRGLAGSLIGGGAGALIGIASAHADDQKKINQRHLERDMRRIQEDRIKDAVKKNQNYITEESRNARSLYNSVKPNASSEEVRSALSKSFKAAERSHNFKTAFGIAARIGIAALPIAIKAYSIKKNVDTINSARQSAERIRNMANDFKAKDYTGFKNDNQTNINYGRVFTNEQLKKYYDVDVTKMKSAGNS